MDRAGLGRLADFLKEGAGREKARTGGRLRTGLARRQTLGPLFWSLAAIGVAALGVQITGTGLEVLLVVIVCGTVVVLERSIGDWMSDLIGPALSSVVLMVVVGSTVWVIFAKNGKADQFYAVAERSGYQTLSHRGSSAAGDANRPPAAGGGPSAHSSPAPARPGPAGQAGIPIPAGSGPTPASKTPSDAAVGRAGVEPTRRVRPLLRVEAPELAATGREVLIRAHVVVDGQPVSGVPVEFTINGRPGGAGLTGGDGAAATVFLPKVARTYHVRARVARSRRFHESVATGLLHVIPGTSGSPSQR